MKALVIHPYMHVLGGGERVCLHIVRALLEDEHDVSLVGESVNQHELEEVLSQEALRKVRWFPYEPFEPRIKKFSVYQRIMHHMFGKSKIKDKIGEVDLEVLTQDVFFLYNIGRKKVAYVHYPEYLVHLEGAKPWSKGFWKLYYAPVLWYWHRQIKKIDLFLCNSEYTKMAIKEKWNKEADVVYPPVDVEKIKPSTKEEFVVSIGRIVKEKNYEILIEAAKLMPEVKFLIVGRKQDEAYYEKLKRIKPDNVTLLTDLSYKDLFSLLSRAKVYLHTMIGEHFGISIVEAMAAGCIPIVHNSGGTKEAIGNLGYVYNNIEECRNKISEAFHRDIDPSRIAQHAKRFSAENFRKEIKEKLKEKHFL